MFLIYELKSRAFKPVASKYPIVTNLFWFYYSDYAQIMNLFKFNATQSHQAGVAHNNRPPAHTIEFEYRSSAYNDIQIIVRTCPVYTYIKQ